MNRWIRKHASKLIAVMLLSILIYGAGRLYFQLTGGFTVSNITSDLSFDSDREIAASADNHEIASILKQEFRYLGKGCQSYVFLSEDGKYVIKFLKYQRFRPQKFLNYLSFIPFIEKIRQQKVSKKNEKLSKLFSSWKIAYENLSKETGVLFLHLNKTAYLKQPLVIYDKLGIKHTLNPDQIEFIVQKRANMLCPTIEEYMTEGKSDEAKHLLTHLVDMILSEYERGFADNDHALMQNTGVIAGVPVHIDVGQFVNDMQMAEKDHYAIELFSKMYKFRIWLAKKYPELESFLTTRLLEIIGPTMWEMTPRLKTVDEGMA